MAAQGEALRVLADADVLMRVLLRKGELDDPRSAFFIRDNERDTGLSVNFDMTPEECKAQACFNKTYGVRSLLVESVKAVNLQVVPDDVNHANITGIPHKEEDPRRAEFLAGELLRVSELLLAGLQKNLP
jgi:hypothetical protein